MLSIDSQVKEMLQMAEREGLEVVQMLRESHSAKATGQREVYNELLRDIRDEKYNGILTWAPDRLSRNAGDLGALVDLMDQGLLHEIRTYGQRFTNNPNEKFLLMILGSQAKLENDNKGVNVKRGLRTRVEMGLWPGVAPLGYLNQKLMDKKCQVVIDRERAPIIKQAFEKAAYEKWSGLKIYHWLKHDLNFKTRGNKSLTLSGLYRMFESPFYYGTFEYPADSGSWYQGKHEPIITKELYDAAYAQMKRDNVVRENKEFAFTKMFTCGLCGSSLSAQEKFKPLKNGGYNRHVYYGCCRGKDRSCTNKYISEEDLIAQLIEIIDKIDINELGIRVKFEEEYKRYNKFKKAILGIEDDMHDPKTLEINIRSYSKYVLREGSTSEKRELLGNLRSRLVSRDKKISLIDV